MTFSICVHEPYRDEDGDRQDRFGVAVTTRLPAVGSLCPYANERGVIAIQSLVDVDLGRRALDYLADGLAVDDALGALLNADDERDGRQVHGVDAASTFVFTGDDARPWAGHRVGDGYTVAGNLLTGADVLDAVAAAYEADRPVPDDDGPPLASRLIDALVAGDAAGGDKRTDLPIGSAALVVTRSETRDPAPFSDDLRVDASETPLVDLRETYELARRGFELAVAKYDAA